MDQKKFVNGFLHKVALTRFHRKKTQKNWKVDWFLHKERHLVECFFNKIKHFRRAATRCDKLAKSFFIVCLCGSGFQIDSVKIFQTRPSHG